MLFLTIEMRHKWYTHCNCLYPIFSVHVPLFYCLLDIALAQWFVTFFCLI